MSSPSRQLTPELDNYSHSLADHFTVSSPKVTKTKGKRLNLDQNSAEKDKDPKISKQHSPGSPELKAPSLYSEIMPPKTNSPTSLAMPYASDRDTKPKALRKPNKELHNLQCIYSTATRDTITDKDGPLIPPTDQPASYSEVPVSYTHLTLPTIYAV